jgi:palmitoyltransferase
MTWISYYMAIFTPPGSPPKDFEPAAGAVKRWCFKCNAYKPERTHHCKSCKTCVLKMDHHCPWTYNCVGYKNMPHFIRFLVWVNLTSGYGFYRLVLQCINLYKNRGLPAYLIPLSEILASVILTPITFFVVFSVGLLSIRVFLNMLNGMTQIESWEEERLASAKRRNLIPRNTYFPYDIDLWSNIYHTWGPMWSWFLPFGRPEGDGINFQKNESGFDDEGNPINWPPDQREVLKPEDTDSFSDFNRTSGELRGFGRGPITFAQTYNSSMQQRSLLFNRSRSNSTSSEESTGYPEWRDQITSDADFYKRELFETFEGEKISDFGVDLDSEVPRPVANSSRRSRPDAMQIQHELQQQQYQQQDQHRSQQENEEDDLPLAALMAKRKQEKTYAS